MVVLGLRGTNMGLFSKKGHLEEKSTKVNTAEWGDELMSQLRKISDDNKKKLGESPEDYENLYDCLKNKYVKYEQVSLNKVEPLDEITLEQFMDRNKDILKQALGAKNLYITRVSKGMICPDYVYMSIESAPNKYADDTSINYYNRYKDYPIVDIEYYDKYRNNGTIGRIDITLSIPEPQPTLKAECLK